MKRVCVDMNAFMCTYQVESVQTIGMPAAPPKDWSIVGESNTLHHKYIRII